MNVEARVVQMRAEAERVRGPARELEARLDREVKRIRERIGAGIVPYCACRAGREPPVRIPVRRRRPN